MNSDELKEIAQFVDIIMKIFEHKCGWYISFGWMSIVLDYKLWCSNGFQLIYTLPANCVESPYPMPATTHGISINLELYHCVATLLFCAINQHQ